MPKCLNVVYVRQLEIEVTIINTTIFVKFSGGFWLLFVFLGFFLWQTLKNVPMWKNTFLNAITSPALEALISVAYSC